MPKTSKAEVPPAVDQLSQPSLIALRKQLASSNLPEKQMPLPGAASEATLSEPPLVSLRGVGAPAGGGVRLSQALLLQYSAYYQHAMSFGGPPADLSLDFGHQAVTLLAQNLSSGSLILTAATVADLLQAAAYLQVAAVLEAAAQYLQDQVLDNFPGVVLRVALDLQLTGLQAHIERDFQQSFFMLSGDKAAALLKEWPPAKRQELLQSPQLCAPTECCLIETLCQLAKSASSAEALALLDCVCFHLMSTHEVAAATLYLQANAKWVDKRLSTALAWRLLNARVAADLAAGNSGLDRVQGTTQPAALRPAQRGQLVVCRSYPRPATAPPVDAAAEAEAALRAARRRSLHWGLRTAELQEWSGTTMYCTQRFIPCSWCPPAARPMVLQLEREDARHAAAEAAGGTSGGSGATSSGGSGWDLQLSLEPQTFPAGFKATCFAFGADGIFWCALGPLARPGPTWWKVGFLASQLPKALPLQQLGRGGGLRGSGGSNTSSIGDGGEGGLLLVGWRVPEQ